MGADGKLLAQIEAFLSWMNGKGGQWFEITENLCSHEENYDRHFTTTVKFKLQLERVCSRFSGARIMCLGYDNGLYEIAVDQIRRIERTDRGFVFIEALSGSWMRRSEIVIWEGTH